jgi:hypothetical protein
MHMIVRIGGLVIAGVLGLMASDARAAQQPNCRQIAALNRFAGGKLSPEELAKKINADVETVRSCLDQNAQKGKPSQAPASATK